jgi:hypothetical protein
VHKNGIMRPVETILRMEEEVIKVNDGSGALLEMSQCTPSSTIIC